MAAAAALAVQPAQTLAAILTACSAVLTAAVVVALGTHLIMQQIPKQTVILAAALAAQSASFGALAAHFRQLTRVTFNRRKEIQPYCQAP
jgi:hypothetical protein